MRAEVKQRLVDCAGRTAPDGDPAVVRNSYRKERTVLTDSIRFSADPAHPRPRLHTGELHLRSDQAIPAEDAAHGRGAGAYAPDGGRLAADGGHDEPDVRRGLAQEPVCTDARPAEEEGKLANSAGADVMAASRQDTGAGSTSSVRWNQRRQL